MSQEFQVFAALILLAQVVNAFMTFRSARIEANKPLEELRQADAKQMESIGQLKNEVKNIKDDLDHAFDKERKLEQSTLVLERGMLALISHSIDGNHTKDLQEAKNELETVI